MLMLMCSMLLMAWLFVSIVDGAGGTNRQLRSLVLGSAGAACLSFGSGGFFVFMTGATAPLEFMGAVRADEVDAQAAPDVRPPEPRIANDPQPQPQAEAEFVEDQSAHDTPATNTSAPDGAATDAVAVDSSLTSEQAPPPADSRVRIDLSSRPEWVEMIPMHLGEVHATAVTSGPFQLRSDSTNALDLELKAKTDEYINEYLGNPLACSFPGLNYDIVQIKDKLIPADKTYHEMIEVVPFGEMHQEHALLEFNEDFRNELDAKWNAIVKTNRLTITGMAAAGVLLLLGLLVSYFRLDTATRGFYTGRLQFATAVAILGLIAAGTLLVKLVPWV